MSTTHAKQHYSDYLTDTSSGLRVRSKLGQIDNFQLISHNSRAS
ncbi:hypothetical protein PVAG01_01272 [Phlyctema vagabunda]|uniref:Uncharacterized protein n=1 Tax=Phlyctema vagabunda TaxID=108571 RepID=A0ABR4PX37_9HELO